MRKERGSKNNDSGNSFLILSPFSSIHSPLSIVFFVHSLPSSSHFFPLLLLSISCLLFLLCPYSPSIFLFVFPSSFFLYFFSQTPFFSKSKGEESEKGMRGRTVSHDTILGEGRREDEMRGPKVKITDDWTLEKETKKKFDLDMFHS